MAAERDGGTERAGFFEAAGGMPPWIPRLLAQVTGVVLLLFAAYHISRALRSFLILILISVFLSIALEPGVAYLETKRGWRRGAATGAIFVVAIVLVGVGIWSMVPLVINQTQRLVDALPGYIERVADFLAQFGIELSTDAIIESVTKLDPSLSGLAGNVGGRILGLGSAVVNTILQMLTIGLFTFYLTADAPRIRRAFLRRIPGHRRETLMQVQEIAVEKTGAYIYSRGLLAAVAALVTWVALRIIGVPFAAPLALWVGVLSQFVPIVGTYLGGLLPLIIALLESPTKALWVLVFIVAYQQFENYIVAPRITARTMSLHPAVAFGSAIVGATLMGVAGALMALPVAATIQAWVSAYGEQYDLVAAADLESAD